MPQASVAVHVLVINFVSPQLLTTVSDSDITTDPHVSDPVAIPVFEEDSSSVHSIVTSAGAVIVGTVVS